MTQPTKLLSKTSTKEYESMCTSRLLDLSISTHRWDIDETSHCCYRWDIDESQVTPTINIVTVTTNHKLSDSKWKGQLNENPLERASWVASGIRTHARSNGNMLGSFGHPMPSPSFAPAELDVHVATVLAGPESQSACPTWRQMRGTPHLAFGPGKEQRQHLSYVNGVEMMHWNRPLLYICPASGHTLVW